MFTRERGFRASMMLTAALGALSFAVVAAQAQGTAISTGPIKPQGQVQPSWGNISPFWGNISPFWGNISPFDGNGVVPQWGNISPFWGNISPFWGNISPFWGNISPFDGTTPSGGTLEPQWGNISPFWGNISPFWGNISPFWGNISPFGSIMPTNGLVPRWGEINSFWGDVGARWGNISPFWGNISPFADLSEYASVADQLKDIVQRSADFWGDAVQQKTGLSFNEGFATPFLVKHGIDLDDPSTLARLSPTERARFFLDWYDGLMEYSGADRIDHWMPTVRWNPALSQIQGAGSGTVIGLLDFTVDDPDLSKSITTYTGVSDFTNGHGAAVASLMISPQDGKGVMGIAPRASVVAYNPFDATGTASWDDVTSGIKTLLQNRASIVNMSLGVPGFTLHPDWNNVFSNAQITSAGKNAVFVIAAGNEGTSQTGNITWNPSNPYFIVVGSIDPGGTISSFSNRPGSACLVAPGGACTADGALKNRFIVAPGEMILVSDDKGGTVRMSGTSLAAPLVSATIALLHDRWPWLAQNPKATTDIILKSAQDLGAPGVDEVYGVGLLDVTASQSPLDLGALRWYQLDKKGKLTQQPVSLLQNADAGQVSKWEASGAFFYAYEDIDGTFRDFSIPLSTKLIGGTTLSLTGRQEKFQQYLYSRFIDWVGKTGNGTSLTNGFTAFASYDAPVNNPYGLNLTMSLAPKTRLAGYRQSSMPYQSALRLSTPGNGFSLTAGAGDGAIALGGHAGFGLASDYDSDMGGANPLLGLASGGAYASARYALGEKVQMAFGVTQRSLRRDTRGMDINEQLRLGGIADNNTSAEHVSVSYSPSPALTLNAGYTRLRENSALLGTQSVDRADLVNGSTTDGATLGMNLAVSGDLNIAASGTFGRTHSSAAARQNIAVGSGGLLTSSYEVAVTKNRLFDNKDRIRVTFSQPMYLEHGSIDYTTVQVVDRQTGELGNVVQSLDLTGGGRQFVTEMLYGRSLMGGTGEVSLFGRARLTQGVTSDALPAYIAGARFRFGF